MIRFLRSIRADKRQLEQVMMNLVVNARDAMPSRAGNPIETEGRASCRHWWNATAPMCRRDRMCRSRFRTKASGSPPTSLQKMFEPFFTTKRTGEGTGLGPVDGIRDRQSRPAGSSLSTAWWASGTAFTLLFPVYEVEAMAPAPIRRNHGGDTSQARRRCCAAGRRRSAGARLCRRAPCGCAAIRC